MLFTGNVVPAADKQNCSLLAWTLLHDDDFGNDFDKIGLGASYSIQGLTFSGAYYQQQDATS